MAKRTLLKALLLVGLTLQVPSQAAACRVGWVQHLFKDLPKPIGLPDAEIIHVQFTNVRPALQDWPRSVAYPDSDYTLPYTLIGAAQTIRRGVARGRPFPVYAFVTSCSGFYGILSGGEPRQVSEGNYYLIGRFQAKAEGRIFLAGGVQVNNGGMPIYQGWHL